MSLSTALKTIEHQADYCIIGAGMAGICAAIAAARGGAKVLLMHDRPVLGGNASSEIRMHVCGADRHCILKNMRETGILEELRLDNLKYNPQQSYPVWDVVMWQKVKSEPNIELLLNCSCLDAEMSGSGIKSVIGWQLTTFQYHKVTAKIFADCSGDAILVPLSGADYRVGREAESEFGESIAPKVADKKTMGMTCMFQSKEHRDPQPFQRPDWANEYKSCDQLPYGLKGHQWIKMGYWWIELGGEDDSITDTETLRDELLKIVYGVWDHIKNHCPNKSQAENYALDWVQFLPGKRESRRYIGPHILTQNDVESEGKFDDIVAYGGWTMDDHHPAGFNAARLNKPATVFNEAPSPYGIPYRTLYSRNIENLMFAGRCASCTHSAMSSTRVMGTAAIQGQAIGTAAAIAIAKGITPAGVNDHIKLLQAKLQADDCYLPFVPEQYCELTRSAKLTANQGNPQPLRDGWNRPIGDDNHCWMHSPGDSVTYSFNSPSHVKSLRLSLDSALDKLIQMSGHQRDNAINTTPAEMPRRFHIDTFDGKEWTTIAHVENNHQRCHKILINQDLHAIRYTLDQTWGQSDSRLFVFVIE